MTFECYSMLEKYMLSCVKKDDPTHDEQHIYRVLYAALEIAQAEQGVDYNILIAACLLHDIGRPEQFRDPKVNHAAVGGDKAYAFLTEHGFSDGFAGRVRECIYAHSYRKGTPPQSPEAKILFDADKLDVAGAVGIARTLTYKGQVGEPLYSILPDGTVSDGAGDEPPSFFQEYKYKLEKMYSRFYTKRGAEMARERQNTAVQFYESIYQETNGLYEAGREHLNEVME